jgi:type I restriction enzyme S subunit
MNAERLLQHYGRIADAPGAIARLRRFVLDLAVRGKLVSQDASDEPAKGFRKPNDPAAPFKLPINWKWIEIGDQLDLLNGMAFKPTDWAKEGLRIVRIQNLNNQDAPFNFCNPEMARERSLIDNGSFLISWSGTPGTSFGAFIWNRGPAVLNQHIFRCDFKTKAFFAAFLRLAINGRLDEMIAKAHGGVGLQHITKGKLEALLIPLPPLAEQHRIVAKVDELMGLCDRLEAARAGREAVRDRLVAASLARLNAPDPETFRDDVRFALDALPALTTRPDQIKRLRQTILNLAVRGKLVEGTAARVASVGDFRTLQNGYAFKSSWFSKEGVRLLRNANIGHGEIRWNDVVHLPKDRLSEFERFQLNEGDIVLTLDRPFIVTGTKVARVSADDLPSLLLQRVGRFVETAPGLDDDYLFLWINSPHFNDQIDPGRSNGVPHISSKQVEAAEILVPPLAEQHRIVAKVDALMALCDRLVASLTDTAATRRRLLDALLAEALAPVDIAEMEAAE